MVGVGELEQYRMRKTTIMALVTGVSKFTSELSVTCHTSMDTPSKNVKKK